MTAGIKNIYKTLKLADAIDINEGRLAYFRYHEVCVNVQARYPEYTLSQIIAVLAATSPNNDYLGNVRSLLTILEAHKAGKSYCKASSYGDCRRRAFTYLNGVSFLETVKGPKIRAFYFNILNPMDSHNVTIDGHAVNMWRGKRARLNDVKAFRYETVANDFRAVAGKEHLLPSQLQAITWLAWKRINRIIYKPPQYKLFEDISSDFWGTLIDLELVKPYDQNYADIKKDTQAGIRTDTKHDGPKLPFS